MTILPRPALALLAIAVLGLGLLQSAWGFYSAPAFVTTLSAMLLSVLAFTVKAEPVRLWRTGDRDGLRFLLAIIASVLCVAAIFNTQLVYPGVSTQISVSPNTYRAMPYFAMLGLIPVAFLLTFGPHFDEERFEKSRPITWPLVLALLLMTGFIVRGCVILASPEPIIDVYNLLRDSADHILLGLDPYSSSIFSPYGSKWAYDHEVFEPYDPQPAGYPPLPYLLAIPPRLFGSDVRWSNVFADLIAAGAIALVGIRRGRRSFGLLAAAIYMHLPRAQFVIEQAWYEPMVAALLGLGLALAEFRGRARWAGYLLLGLGLTAKQYGLPLLLPLAWAHRRHWKLLALGIAVGVAIMLPWIIASPSAFFEIVLLKHLDRPLQPHSITVASFLLNEFDLTMPRIAGWLLAGGAILGISVITPKGSAATALGLGTALLAFCVFHTQGFPNYFYLVQYLWLLGFVGLLPRTEPENQTNVDRSPA